ncbi:hypothetical protein AOLI_G00203260 [Acnodon oligacanthus]
MAHGSTYVFWHPWFFSLCRVGAIFFSQSAVNLTERGIFREAIDANITFCFALNDLYTVNLTERRENTHRLKLKSGVLSFITASYTTQMAGSSLWV